MGQLPIRLDHDTVARVGLTVERWAHVRQRSAAEGWVHTSQHPNLKTVVLLSTQQH